MAISDRIKERMKELDMRPADIARESGVSKGAVSQWVNGISEPNARNILLLSKTLKCSAPWLQGLGRAVREKDNQEIENIYADLEKLKEAVYQENANPFRDSIIENINKLMNHYAIRSPDELANLAYIEPSFINDFMGGELRLGIPSLHLINEIAKVFDIPPWMLTIPKIPIEMLTTPSLKEVVNTMCKVDVDGKREIYRVAKNELRYWEGNPEKQ